MCGGWKPSGLTLIVRPLLESREFLPRRAIVLSTSPLTGSPLLGSCPIRTPHRR